MNCAVSNNIVLAVLCIVAAPGCTSLTPQATAPAPTHSSSSAPYAIAQLGFGDAAHFGLCLPPACPTVTPKTASPARILSQQVADYPLVHAATIEQDTLPQRNQPLNLLTIYFRPGESFLNSDARRAIDGHVASMPAVRIQVAARTDSTGSLARNDRIAQRRAEAVTKYLKSLPAVEGIPVESDAAALCCYVADNADANGRRLNRRVDITLITPDRLGAL